MRCPHCLQPRLLRLRLQPPTSAHRIPAEQRLARAPNVAGARARRGSRGRRRRSPGPAPRTDRPHTCRAASRASWNTMPPSSACPAAPDSAAARSGSSRAARSLVGCRENGIVKRGGGRKFGFMRTACGLARKEGTRFPRCAASDRLRALCGPMQLPSHAALLYELQGIQTCKFCFAAAHQDLKMQRSRSCRRHRRRRRRHRRPLRPPLVQFRRLLPSTMRVT